MVKIEMRVGTFIIDIVGNIGIGVPLGLASRIALADRYYISFIGIA